MEFAIVIEGFSPGGYVGDLSPEKVASAAAKALNKISDKTRTKADRMIREQIAFPARYLGPASKRLWVQARASGANLEAVVRGRGRPTSLARFSSAKPLSSGARHKGGKVDVTVKPGVRKYISRAFIMRLRGGNLGLAIRTSGGSPAGAYKPTRISDNLWLLYGPSVNQALIGVDRAGIYEDLSPTTLDELEAEFYRLIELEEKNG